MVAPSSELPPPLPSGGQHVTVPGATTGIQASVATPSGCMDANEAEAETRPQHTC